MITVDQSMDIKELNAAGHSIRAIERLTGHSRNTIRKVVRGEHQHTFQTPERGSKLDPFKPYLQQRFAEVDLSAVRLLEEIRGMGYTGSIQTLRRFMMGLKSTQRRLAKSTVRFETAPGKQAQVDWTYCGKFPTPDGKLVSVYGFAMVLSYSRMLYVEFTTSMKTPALLDCHERAFAALGGIPETILYDNMKQVRLDRSRLNEQFVDFASHYGFTIKTHRAYRPRTKGKIERPMTYIKDNFLKGRSFTDLDHLNAAGQHWLATTANVRTHGTTQERPCDRHRETEMATLQPLAGMRPYVLVEPKMRRVSAESMIRYAGSQYSVPPAHVGQEVQVEAQAGLITIRCADLVIAEHHAAQSRGQCIVNHDHLAELWKVMEQQIPAPKDQQPWQVRFDQQVATTPLMTYAEITA